MVSFDTMPHSGLLISRAGVTSPPCCDGKRTEALFFSLRIGDPLRFRVSPNSKMRNGVLRARLYAPPFFDVQDAGGTIHRVPLRQCDPVHPTPPVTHGRQLPSAHPPPGADGGTNSSNT